MNLPLKRATWRDKPAATKPIRTAAVDSDAAQSIQLSRQYGRGTNKGVGQFAAVAAGRISWRES